MKAFTFVCLAASLLVFAQCGSKIRSIGRRIAAHVASKSNPMAMKPGIFHKSRPKHILPIPVPIFMPHRNRFNSLQELEQNTTDTSQVESTTTEEPATSQDNDKSTTIGGSIISKSPEDIRQKIKEQVETLTELCKTQTKLLPEHAKIATNMAVPKTEAEKCFLECIYNGIGLTKDGTFYEQGARTLAQQRFASAPDDLTKANSMIEACTKEVVVKDANEKCGLGRLVRECFVKNGAKINFFPKP